MDPHVRQRVTDLLPAKVSYVVRARRRRDDVASLLDFIPPGCVVADIGANRGVYTYWFARRAGVVHAFEPLPVCAEYLSTVASSNVKVHAMALSDRSGMAVLRVPREDRESSLSVATPASDSIQVRTARLDDLDLPPFDFLKIDVEGHELQVLEGAVNSLASLPTLYIEIEQRHLGSTPITKVFDQIGSIGYGFGFAHRPSDGFVELGHFDLERDQLSRLSNVMSASYIHNFLFTARPLGA